MVQDQMFAVATPAATAPLLDGSTIHLWRIRYALSEGRAPLVRMLAAYLRLAAGDVELVEAAGGKPELSGRTLQRLGDALAGALEFNWSHSGDYALIALTRDVALGVDIEHVRARMRTLEIAQRFFDPGEAAALRGLDAGARDGAFIALWCAKEALLKARGKGLAFGLERAAFSPTLGPAWQPRTIDAGLGGTGGWQLAQFEPAPRYRGAVAWRGEPRRLLAFQPA